MFIIKQTQAYLMTFNESPSGKQLAQKTIQIIATTEHLWIYKSVTVRIIAQCIVV